MVGRPTTHTDTLNRAPCACTLSVRHPISPRTPLKPTNWQNAPFCLLNNLLLLEYNVNVFVRHTHAPMLPSVSENHQMLEKREKPIEKLTNKIECVRYNNKVMDTVLFSARKAHFTSSTTTTTTHLHRHTTAATSHVPSLAKWHNTIIYIYVSTFVRRFYVAWTNVPRNVIASGILLASVCGYYDDCPEFEIRSIRTRFHLIYPSILGGYNFARIFSFFSPKMKWKSLLPLIYIDPKPKLNFSLFGFVNPIILCQIPYRI